MTRVVRVLSIAEACDGWCNSMGCESDPTFQVATPDGPRDYCDDHVDAAVRALPEDWLRGFSPADLAAPWEDD